MDKPTRMSLALNYLYLNCKESQDELQPHRNQYSDLSFAKEYCTIQMTSSRRSGHTQAIAQLCNELQGHWIILSHNQKMAELINKRCGTTINQVKRQTRTEITSDNLSIAFKSYNNLDSLRGYDLDGVIVDGAFGLTTTKKDELYRILIPSMRYSKYMFFIFVG